MTTLESINSFLRTLPPPGPEAARFAVFDCDGTVIKGDIGESMLYHQIRHFLFRRSPAEVWSDHPLKAELHSLYLDLASLSQAARIEDDRFNAFAGMILGWYFDQLAAGKTVKACSDIVKLFAGFSLAEVRRIASDTLEAELQLPLGQTQLAGVVIPTGIRFIREAVDILTLLRDNGIDIWAVSGSNLWSVQAVFRRLSVPGNQVIGIDLHSTGGVFDARPVEPVPVLDGKIGSLQSRITHAPILVASDSIFDLPLLTYSAGVKILVNTRPTPSSDFFAQTAVHPDDSWIVIEHPTAVD